jgi:hypothetical protein
MKDANDLYQLNKDSFYSKALPAKIDYEKLSPYFAFRPHDVIQHTSRQTKQLAISTIYYPMRRHLKSRFQMLNHKCLVEWNDVNKTKSWVNYFALSISNPKPIISLE